MKKLAVILAFLALVGCTELKEGTVVDKRFHESYTYLQPSLVGKTTIMIPVTNPERFGLVIEGIGTKGKTIREEHTVDAITWHETKIGDHWVAQP